MKTEQQIRDHIKWQEEEINKAIETINDKRLMVLVSQRRLLKWVLDEDNKSIAQDT